jgi:phosphoglycerol transferase MdoB-like AlkP superfamily enzyme
MADLLEFQDVINSIISTAQSFYWAFYVSAGFAVLVDIVVLILVFGIYLAWRKKLNKPFIRMRCCMIIPMFVLFVFLMWLFAIIFCFTAILTADFCYDGPDPSCTMFSTTTGNYLAPTPSNSLNIT